MIEKEVLGEWRDDLTSPEKIITAEVRLSHGKGPKYTMVTVNRYKTKAELVKAFNKATPKARHIEASY